MKNISPSKTICFYNYNYPAIATTDSKKRARSCPQQTRCYTKTETVVVTEYTEKEKQDIKRINLNLNHISI